MLLYDDARGRPNSSLLIVSPLASAEKAESGGGGSIPDFSCRRRRGFFPLSRTRALIPTRLTSWCIALQSETGRAYTLHRVLVTRIVLGGTIPDAVRPGRAGVTKGQLCTAAFAVKEHMAVLHSAGDAHAGWAGTARVASSNASLGGPQEKPMNEAKAF